MLKYIFTYYVIELNQKYKEFRDNNVISTDVIYNIAKDWIESIGLNTYALENNKWSSVKAIDNMARIRKWIEKSIRTYDAVYRYNN